MDEDQMRAFLGFLFCGAFHDIALVEEEFIDACSEISKCENHGYHLEQDAKRLNNDRIC